MSGLIHDVGKAFSAVWDFIKPIVKVVAIAAAVYFTAGVALSYFAPTAAFAASLPGFAAGGTLDLGVGAGAEAGTGIFSEAAANLGLGQGLATGALADGATSADLAATGFSASTIDAAGGAAGAAGAAGTPAIADAAGYTDTFASGAGAGGNAAAAGAGAVPGTTGGAAAGTSSLTDKLLLASVGTQTLSGLLAPSPASIQAAKNGFYGSFYGMGSGGNTSPAPNLSVNPGIANPGSSSTVSPATQIPGINIPGQNATTATGQPGGGANAQTTMQSAQAANLIPSISYSGQPLPGSTPDFAVQGSTPLTQPKLINTPGTAG